MTIDHIEAIKRLKHRYFKACDTKDPAALRACFVSVGAELDYGPRGHTDADAMAASYETVARDADGNVANLDAHLGLHPEIDLVSDTEATGTWVLQFRRVDRIAKTEMVMAGEYSDRYVIEDGVWKIKACTFRATWGRIVPLPESTFFV